jgi:Protein of unknown function (DUF3659)
MRIGSTIGKAEISLGLLEKGKGATSEPGSKLPEDAKSKVEGPEGELPEGAEAKDKVDGVDGEIPEGEEVKDKAEGAEGELEQSVEAKDKVEGLEGELPEDAKSKVEGVDGVIPDGEDAKDKVEGPEGELPEGEDVKDKVEGAEGELPAGIEVPDLSILKGKTVNKLGKIVSEDGTPFGVLVEGDPKKLLGKKVDDKGCIWDDSGM